MSSKQLDTIINYMKENEKKKNDFKLGAEFEYFVVDKESLNVIGYEGEKGVLSTLTTLLNDYGYEGIYENNHLLGLIKDQTTITLEPGCQLEISVKPEKELSSLDEVYKTICADVLSVLNKKNQTLMACGYQVQTPIDKVNLIPKQRYHYMYEYFSSCGEYAHNMMKQTASTQVCIDYENEEDYSQKYCILNSLSPVFYAFFDNSPFFESEVYSKQCIRSQIWEYCDKNRCGIIQDALTDDFNYETYAQYILNKPVIFMNNSITNGQPFKDFYHPENKDELEHALSMVFPDVRTRKFIEIRMMDSLPYPLNISVVALIKGLFYNEDNLKELSHFVSQINKEDVISAKNEINEKGIDVLLNGYSIYEIMKYLYTLAYKGLNDNEKKYLDPMMPFIQARITPQQLTKKQLSLGKHQALRWCLLQEPLFWEDFTWMQAV